MRLAREFKRPDWRQMLSEISSTELGEWAEYYRENRFSDALLDAEFSSLKATMVALFTSGDEEIYPGDLSILTSPEPETEQTDDELMLIGEGIFGGVRYGGTDC
ncbi:phage tail assembly protein T [Serratia quinivorans]|uniref:Phage tail assembly protein T n=1 Tax=Serratia quinivorans TaxID=137545 RepID=A0A380AU67_9GAMM|nr:phage tail assembly protein T [Serratia proteamaculans]RYM60030.1 phage tail assembly protein T [Serratia proteamaculans]SUI86791.1 phage tail assembly protein T [Serratia quinivorans]